MKMGTNSAAIASLTPTLLSIFVTGDDSGIYENVLQITRWSGWHKLACGRFSTFAVSTKPNHIDLFTVGMDNGAIWHTFKDLRASSTVGAAPYCCGLRGTACCPASTGQPYTCLAYGADACDPNSRTCVECGASIGEPCCSGGGQLAHCDSRRSVICNVVPNACVSNSVCGNIGQICCSQSGSGCLSNNCVGAVAGQIVGTCEPPKNPPQTCSPGGVACGSGCCSGLGCQGGTCAKISPPKPTTKTCSGQASASTAQNFTIPVLDSNRCIAGNPVVFANSLSEASGCVAKLWPGYSPVTPGTLSYYQYAQYGFGTCQNLSIAGYSQQDADQCAQSGCTNCATYAGQTCPP